LTTVGIEYIEKTQLKLYFPEKRRALLPWFFLSAFS
jgi:hypothetical protein